MSRRERFHLVLAVVFLIVAVGSRFLYEHRCLTGSWWFESDRVTVEAVTATLPSSTGTPIQVTVLVPEDQAQWIESGGKWILTVEKVVK